MARLKEHYHDEIEARRSNSDGNYEGYFEAQFISAFDQLCKDAGSYKEGKQLAEKLLNEQVI
ncbi:MAG: hypothetical protein COB78_09920 [Hyphomicrobiales bacterium]|nr:MAG: hypothetical protein COB78_09920 [Hyphomicrobiales bacterium]